MFFQPCVHNFACEHFGSTAMAHMRATSVTLSFLFQCQLQAELPPRVSTRKLERKTRPEFPSFLCTGCAWCSIYFLFCFSQLPRTIPSPPIPTHKQPAKKHCKPLQPFRASASHIRIRERRERETAGVNHVPMPSDEEQCAPTLHVAFP